MHVGGLTAGIGIPAQFQVLAAKQAVEMQMQQVKTHQWPSRLTHA
jgi:hypothetical protein